VNHTHPADLTCRELVELVTDYLEGGLSAHDRSRFEQHLALCEGCVAYMVQMRSTIRLAGTLREEHLQPRVREALLHAFRGWAAT
jgi:anti-sigma factor RsiW